MDKKHKIGITLSTLGMVMILFGVTFSFFNYTRTGVSNTIKVGRIYFESEQTNTITLLDVFPIDASDANTSSHVGTGTINITGDTTYDDGVEYQLTISNLTNTVGSKEIPIDVVVTATGIGDSEDDYFNARGEDTSIYKVLSTGTISNNKQLLVGYIPKGSTGVDGTVTIKAYLDKEKIAISDTYPEETVRKVVENYSVSACETALAGNTNASTICASANSIENAMGSLTSEQITALVTAGVLKEYTNETPASFGEGRTVLTTQEWNELQANGISFQVKVEANEGVWVENPSDFKKIIEKKASTVNYIASYDDIISSNPTFTTQDHVSTSSTKQAVYYFTGDDAVANSNVLFAGYCWQIIRTTDNGGVRLIYNGVAVNNKCDASRVATKGINSSAGTNKSFSAATLFGRSYDYNLDTGVFTLQDSTGLPTALNETNYQDLIGTYTCNSSSSTCTTLYYIGSYVGSTYAYTTSYTIGDVAHFSQMGTSSFNSNYKNPASVGYMFNEEYNNNYRVMEGEYYTNAVWENGTYTLSNGNGGNSPDATHHYICDDSNCTKVRYYYYSTNNYILLENGVTVEDALYKMTGYGNATTLSKPINANYKLNNYNSAIKGYLDNWYKKNLTEYTSYIDETSVYCNDRSIIELGGWNPSGTDLSMHLKFKQNSANRDLNCVNDTDRFAVTNSKAKLSYPIGLLTEPERNLMAINFAKTGQYYWMISPNYFLGTDAYVRFVDYMGESNHNDVYNNFGVRGVVTLKQGTSLENGLGTYDNPYVIGPLVTRTN